MDTPHHRLLVVLPLLSLGGDGRPSSLSPSGTPSPLSLGGDEHPSPSSIGDTPSPSSHGDGLPLFERVFENKELFEPLYDGADITICGAYCCIMQFASSNNLILPYLS